MTIVAISERQSMAIVAISERQSMAIVKQPRRTFAGERQAEAFIAAGSKPAIDWRSRGRGLENSPKTRHRAIAFWFTDKSARVLTVPPTYPRLSWGNCSLFCHTPTPIPHHRRFYQ
jgi:hypothetical protein